MSKTGKAKQAVERKAQIKFVLTSKKGFSQLGLTVLLINAQRKAQVLEVMSRRVAGLLPAHEGTGRR
jgi:hypothetical protein